MDIRFLPTKLKKYKEDDFKTKEDIINIKKDKILSLRKKKNKKHNFNRILGEKEKEEAKKYAIYEFQEIDFQNAKNKYMKKKEIFNLSFGQIYKSDPYDNEELKYWLYSVYRSSNKGKSEALLNILTEEKIKFLIDILTDSSQFNYSNNNSINFEQIKIILNSNIQYAQY